VTLAAGEMIGERYEIEGKLGQGGMQEVYMAQDTVLKKTVALKVPKTPSASRRFLASAIMSARVNHPNTAKTLDYVTTTESDYLIEEYIEGRDLSKLRARMPLMDPYLVAHFLHHLSRGIAASHHVKVVHRDLKPSNIMVSPGFAFEAIKITDFGIAKMAEEEIEAAVEGGDVQTMTNSSTAIGALPYMAPEMMTSARKSGTPADIWAVGAICYELLTGEKPFGQGLQVVLNVANRTMTPPPSHLDKVQFRGLTTDLLALLHSCMTNDAAARPTADQLVTACTNLCYPPSARATGTLTYVGGNGAFGKIRTSGSGEDIFFHRDSLYGPRLEMGDRVCFAAFPGTPNARAHPIVKLHKPSDAAIAAGA